MLKHRLFFILFISQFLTACTACIINSSTPVPIKITSKIAVVPFSNYTETPLANERAKAITASTLEAMGFHNLVVYQASDQNNTLLSGMNTTKSRRELLTWARRHHAHYVMTGSVNEWTYKVGLDGEPVVGVSLQLIELPSERILWTAVGSESGGSRIAVTTVAQKLITSMLRRLCPSNHHRHD